MKVLIVDDEETNIALIRAALKDIDHELIVAHDGEQGIALAKAEMPDVIILDVMMPKFDGFKVCGMLKSDKRFARISVIILSSRAGDDDVQIAREVGADIYMVKPFDQDELNRNVKQLLNT
ncbi:MAG: response regulator [Candidatus Omnitrophica bacterium]|nr:response regulator [Candidatus Omnitrophota bacterium]MCK5259468.1 response regulator [Candidatus Omnitrophota bacterium]